MNSLPESEWAAWTQRCPIDLYRKICQAAKLDDLSITEEVNKLLVMGISKSNESIDSRVVELNEMADRLGGWAANSLRQRAKQIQQEIGETKSAS